jgi:hypothetical protein
MRLLRISGAGLALFSFFAIAATAIAPFGKGQIGNATGDEGKEN